MELALCESSELHQQKKELCSMSPEDREKVMGVIQKAQASLDKAMAHFQMCTNRGRFARLCNVAADSFTFILSQQLHNVCSLFSFDEAIDLQEHLFHESQQLRQIVQSMGRSQAVCASESLTEKVLEAMDESKSCVTDQMTLQAATDSNWESFKSNEGIQEIPDTLAVQNELLVQLRQSWQQQQQVDADMAILTK